MNIDIDQLQVVFEGVALLCSGAVGFFMVVRIVKWICTPDTPEQKEFKAYQKWYDRESRN